MSIEFQIFTVVSALGFGYFRFAISLVYRDIEILESMSKEYHKKAVQEIRNAT